MRMSSTSIVRALLGLVFLMGLSQSVLGNGGFTDLEGEAAHYSDYVPEDR